MRAHVGRPVLLKFDLQDSFSSVRASRVHALFTTLGHDDPVARELTALGPASQNHAAPPQWQEPLRGRLAWAVQLNPEKARRLQRWFDFIDWVARA